MNRRSFLMLGAGVATTPFLPSISQASGPIAPIPKPLPVTVGIGINAYQDLIRLIRERTIGEVNSSELRRDVVDLTQCYIRGVVRPYDYKVVCDECNNTPEMIDRGGFRVDVYVRRMHSVGFDHLLVSEREALFWRIRP